MRNKRFWGKILAVLLLVIILGLFVYYVHDHPAVINVLRRLNPWLIVLLIALYGIMLVIWMEIYNTILSLCGKPLKIKENLLLTIYSTLANFFLPLQSGPGVRAGYLKKRHQVTVSSYIMSTLIYFGFYAVISAAFLFMFSTYWYLALPAIIAASAISLVVIYFAKQRFTKKNSAFTLNLDKKILLHLFLLTLAQLCLQTIIYGIELRSLGLHYNLTRAFSYTGAASFSLFVSLTPGAIGFREAFLEFTKRIHHFSTTNILSANLIDRGVFLAFLGLLFITMLLTHARDKLKI